MITADMRPDPALLSDHSLEREVVRSAFDICSWSSRPTTAVVLSTELILVSDISVAVCLFLITFSLFSDELLDAYVGS